MSKMKLPLILVIALAFALLFGKYIPIEIKQFLFSLSLSIKDILIFFLPLIIASFVSHSLLKLESKGVLSFVLFLIPTVLFSNLIGIFLGYGVGMSTIGFFNIPQEEYSNTLNLLPFWNLNLPKLVKNEHALIFGFFIGILFTFKRNRLAERIVNIFNNGAVIFLKRFFVPILPIFILGYLLKLEHEQLLIKALKVYGPIMFVVISLQITYCLFYYLFANKFSIQEAWSSLKNVFPATMTAFSTISSAAAMPVLILSSEKNLGKDSKMAKTIVPAVINIHTIGSAISMTIWILATMTAFNYPLPDLSLFTSFAILYAFMKFTAATVPAGMIVVVTPLVDQHLGFSGDMIGMLTAIYVLSDPFGTATNVTVNGAFTILFNRIYNALNAGFFKS